MQIRKGHTGIIIDPYKKGQCRMLEKMTSVYDYVKRRYEPLTGYCINLGNRDVFVTHPMFDTFLHSQFSTYDLIQLKSSKSLRIEPFQLNDDIIPTEIQHYVISEIMKSKYHSWYVHLSQGMGKTLLSVYLISVFRRKTLIMCFRKKILNQWYATLKDKTDIDINRVLIIDSSKIFEKIIEGSFPVEKFDIFLCTPGIITSYAKRNSYENIDILMKKMGIGFKIYDEAHRDIKNMILINGFSNVDKTLYLSGDKKQSNDINTSRFQKMFQLTQFITPDKEITDKLKYIVGVVVNYNTYPSSIDEMSCYEKRGFSFFNCMKYEIENKRFYDALFYTFDHIMKSNQGKHRILILTHMVEHVDIIYENMCNRYNDKIIFGKFYSDIDDNEKDYVKMNADCIVATYLSFSTGLDAPNIRYVISTSPCSIIDDNQSSGRARPLPSGEDCFYFMLNDIGFEYNINKIEKRVSYLLETKLKKCIKINV